MKTMSDDNDDSTAVSVAASTSTATAAELNQNRLMCENCSNDRFFADFSSNACEKCANSRSIALICVNCNRIHCATCKQKQKPAATAVVAATSKEKARLPLQLTIHAARGYVYAAGPAIERAAARFLSAVPTDWVMNRQRRDGGDEHHITVLSKFDLAAISANRNEVLRAFADTLPVYDGSNEPFQVLGVGSAVDGDSVAVFVVVEWPELDVVRTKLGLPHHDPHITLGFKRADIHGVSKNITALISDDVDAVADRLASLKLSKGGGGGGGGGKANNNKNTAARGRKKK